MGKISTELLDYEKSIRFYKKALQYAWKTKDVDAELRMYDWLGQAFCNQGHATYALYYHNRYILGEQEDNDSAVRRISF